MTPEPPPPSDAPRSYGSPSWPDGFRGIGGHLIRPTPASSASTPVPSSSAEFASHGSHLLSPIEQSEDGSRSARCPVCRTAEPLALSGGWLPIHCRTCGTEFVATDGSPPPVLPPPPSRPSPIAPPSPLEPLPPLADRPRSFTSDVRTDEDGRMWVTCPQCRRADVTIPRGATVAVVLRCPACHGPFLVGLGSPSPSELPEPPEPPPLPFNPDGRVWDYCPRCGREALSPERVGGAYVLTCGVCGQQVLVSEGPYPPRPLALPAQPSIWERIRRLFRRG